MDVLVTHSEEETRELGKRIGQLLEPGTVIALNGTLGSGKTRFTQGIGRGLGVANDLIVSPTYTLCVPYDGRLALIHLDAYRIKDPAEVDELGLDELVDDGAVLVVEWAEKIAPYLPEIDIEVSFKHESDDSRSFRFQLNSKYEKILAALDVSNWKAANG